MSVLQPERRRFFAGEAAKILDENSSLWSFFEIKFQNILKISVNALRKGADNI